MNKKLKIGIGLSVSLILASATIPLAVTLSSCSSTKKPSYSYDSAKNALEIDSKALFGNNNIFYGFQKIKYDTQPGQSTGTQYNLVAAINKLVEPTYGPDFIKELNTTDVTNEKDGDPFVLKVGVVGAVDKKFIKGKPQPTDVQEILIKFPKIATDKLPWQSPIEIQAGVYFGNSTIQEISSWPVENIVSAIGNSIIPEGTTIGSNKVIINGQTKMELNLFIPNSGISKLIINFAPLEVPNVEPSPIISNSNVENDWQSIINWSPELPSNISYTTIDNPTGQSGSKKPILASYSLAEQGSVLLNKFNSSFYSNASNKTFNMNAVNEDVDYFIKNYLANVANTWDGQNILNSNVYAGNNLVANNGTLTGNIAIQFQNTSNKKQSLVLPITKQSIEVKPNDVVSILIKLNNSEMSPYLIQKDYRQNTAYLTSAFSNVSMQVAVNNSLFASSNSENLVNIFPYSIVLKSIVGNVKDGDNYITETNEFEKLYQKEFGVAPQVDEPNKLQQVYENAITNDVQNTINKMNTIIGAIQGIAFKWAANPTILEFLQNISQELYNLLYSNTNNSQLSKIVSSLFSQQPVSVFLYFNWENLVELLEGLNIPGLQIQIDSLVNLIKQIGNENTTLPEMKQWVENVASLYSTLEKVLGENDSLNWLLPLIKHLMDTLSKDPSIVHFVFMNLNAILTDLGTGASSNAPKILVEIMKGLSEYMGGLLAYEPPKETINKSNTDNDPEDLTKYDSITVLDPILYANNSTSYKSLFTCLADNISDATVKNILSTIGKIFDLIKFDANKLTVSDIQSFVKELFTVKLTNTTNKETTDNNLITLSDLFMNHVLYQESDSKTKSNLIERKFVISFDVSFEWDFSNLKNFISSISINTSLGGFVNGLISSLLKQLNLGGVFLPNKLIVSKSNNLTLSYIFNPNIKPTPFVDNLGNLSWKFRTQKNIYLNINQLFTDMVNNGTDNWNPLSLNKKLINLIKQIVKLIPNLNIPEWIWPILEKMDYVSIPKGIFDLLNNIFGKGVVQNTWIYTDPMENVKFKTFDSKAGLPGVSFEPNKNAGFLETNFRTWLKSQILTNVKWEGSSQIEQQDGDTSTSLVPTMVWTKPQGFDQQLARYFNFGDLFNQQEAYPFIDWSTDLGAFRMTIGSDLYTIYDFHINFSVPTVVKNAFGKYAVKDRVDYFFINKEAKANTRN